MSHLYSSSKKKSLPASQLTFKILLHQSLNATFMNIVTIVENFGVNILNVSDLMNIAY